MRQEKPLTVWRCDRRQSEGTAPAKTQDAEHTQSAERQKKTNDHRKKEKLQQRDLKHTKLCLSPPSGPYLMNVMYVR